MKRSRLLSLLLAVSVAMTMASSPAMAGKKKTKTDPMRGHLYEPVAPVTHRKPVLENLDADVVDPAKMAKLEMPTEAEDHPVVYPINGVETLVMHLLFE